MTHSYQTSALYTPTSHFVNNDKTHLFQIEITDFDNEIYSLEVEANSYSEASEKASVGFSGDIYNMNIYQLV